MSKTHYGTQFLDQQIVVMGYVRHTKAAVLYVKGMEESVCADDASSTMPNSTTLTPR